MVKVLFVDQISGINWKYSFSLANSLMKPGIDLTVATDFLSDNSYCKCPTIPLFNTDEKNISKIKKLINYIRAYKKLIKYVKKNQIQVVHLEWINFSPIDYIFIKKLHRFCKIVFTIHDVFSFNSHFYDNFFYKRIYSLPNAIILQTEENVMLFSKSFPKISKSKIHLCYHGNFLAFSKPLEMSESRKKLDLPKDSFIYLFFGQLKKIKGVDLLINAFSEVAKERKNVFLVIAGNVWHNNAKPYLDLIKALKIDDKVRTDIRFIPDSLVDYYFSSADIVCLPYTELFQSGVVQQSYAYKKPAIVSSLPGFLTVVRNQQNGFVFKSGDYIDLSKKMLLAYDERQSLPVLGEEGYRFIKERYSWNKIAEETYRIYLEVLQDR